MASINLRNFSKLTYPSMRIFRLGFCQTYYPINQKVPFKNLHTTPVFEAQGLPIKMPSLSPTMMEGTIVKWMKEEGDSVQPGDVLCDIQTDKAVVSLETDEEGILAKILKGNDSDMIKVGTLIALLVEEGEDWKNVEMPSLVDNVESQSMESDAIQTPISGKKEASSNFGPSVRLLLEKYGISATEVPAAGPHGKLLKGDLLRYIELNNKKPSTLETIDAPSIPATKKSPAPRPPTASVVLGEQYNDIQLTSMRKTIAKRLTQSKSSIAHTYSTCECSMDKLIKLRKQFKSDGIKVSVNDFVIKSVAIALTRCPDINCVWEDGQLVRKSEVDISVAVATEAGLITPIVKGADCLGLQDISSRVRELASRAKNNKLKLNEFQGGSFTISNLGMFGIKEFTAIINLPQCGILAVGGSLIAINEFGLPETRMRATLSYDQAAIGDDSAAIFMQTLKEILEDPEQILLGSYSKTVDHPLAALL